MPKNWAQVKPHLHSYYVIQQKPMSEIQTLMKTQHGFKAWQVVRDRDFLELMTDVVTSSARSYRTKLKDWGYLKQDNKNGAKNTEPHNGMPGASLCREASVASDDSNESANGRNDAFQSATTVALITHEMESEDPHALDDIIQSLLRNFSYTSFDHLALAEFDCPCPHTPVMDGINCLHDAAREGSVHWIRHLLYQGAVATIKDSRENTPLHICILNSPCNTDIVRLLANPAVINVPNVDGLSPFHLILRKKELQHAYADMVRHFLDLGADPRLPFPDGRLPLPEFLLGCNSVSGIRDHSLAVFDVLQTILGRVDAPSVHRAGPALLTWVLEGCFLNRHYSLKLTKLLCSSLDIDRDSDRPAYPLHQVIQKLGDDPDYHDCAKILLDRHADPDWLDAYGNSPLRLLVRLKLESPQMIRTVKLLLHYGANPLEGLGQDWIVLFVMQTYQEDTLVLRSVTKLLLSASCDRILMYGPENYYRNCTMVAGDETAVSTNHRIWVARWVAACHSYLQWSSIKGLLEPAARFLPLHVRVPITETALEILGEKCIEAAEKNIEDLKETDYEEVVRRRSLVKSILGDFDRIGIPPRTAWLYPILKICG